jgi:hypothetical protein
LIVLGDTSNSSLPGEIEEGSAAFYVVREVRVTLHKVHVCAFIHSV